MECLITFLVLLGMLALFSASLARFQSGGGRRRRSYQRLAKRHTGSYVPGGLISRPSVRIRYGETRAVLCEAPCRGPYDGKCTQIQIEWPDYHLVCEVLPTAQEARPLARGLGDYRIEDHRFDRRFQVRGTGEREIRELLSDGVRWQIDRVFEVNGDPEFFLQIRRGTILIQKPRLIRRYEELEEFISRALELYDQIMLTRAEGIEFVADNQAQTLEDVICKVCGDTIIQDLVYCQRCKTPHHGECWRYAGACSVYGCQERNYLHPQAATPAHLPHTAPSSTKPR